MSKRFVHASLVLSTTLLLAHPVQADFKAAAKNISNTPTVDSKHPKVAHILGTEDVFVIWTETDGTNDHLYFSKSKDSGVTWTAPFQLTLAGQILEQWALSDDTAYAMVVSDPYIHIVLQWRGDSSDDFEIVYMRSSDLGETAENWDVWLPLTDNDTATLGPDIAACGEYVHVTYYDSWPGNYDIMYKRITGYGGGSIDLTRRLTFSPTDSYVPKIAVGNDGQCVSIVYTDDYSGKWNVFCKHIEDSGAGSHQTLQLTFNTTATVNGRADIAAGTGTYEQYIYIAYESNYPGNREVMYKRLDNYGHSPFNTYTARLTYSSQNSYTPSIDFDTAYGNVHITYYDNWTGNWDVMHRVLTGGGGDGFVGQRVSWGSGDSSHSSVAASGQWAYIAWHDNTSGNYEIYVKYGNAI
jgi:hypothetical protein